VLKVLPQIAGVVDVQKQIASTGWISVRSCALL
jgi:hypothetical protein